MYFLLKMVTFQPAMLVYQRVSPHQFSPRYAPLERFHLALFWWADGGLMWRGGGDTISGKLTFLAPKNLG